MQEIRKKNKDTKEGERLTLVKPSENKWATDIYDLGTLEWESWSRETTWEEFPEIG